MPRAFRPFSSLRFSRGEFSPSLVPHTHAHVQAYTHRRPSSSSRLSLSLAPKRSSSRHDRLSFPLSLSPYESRVLPSPSPAVLSLSLFLPPRSVSLSLSPRVSFSPAFLTARVRSLLHEGGETSVALRGSTRARAESRLIADAECAERFLRGVSLCILLLHVRPYD